MTDSMTFKMAVNLKKGDRVIAEADEPLVVKAVNWINDRLLYVEYESGPISWDHVPPQRMLVVEPR